jgi:hypothetical protein
MGVCGCFELFVCFTNTATNTDTDTQTQTQTHTHTHVPCFEIFEIL